MERSSTNRGEGGDADPVPATAAEPGPGRRLREAREAAGQSIEAIAGELHLNAASIEALEADDYSKFPAPIFISGYVRKYAAQLGLDPGPLLASLDAAGLKTPPIRSELTASFPAPARRGLPPGARIAFAGIAGLVALAIAWNLIQSPAVVDAPPPIDVPVETPVETPPDRAGESPLPAPSVVEPAPPPVAAESPPPPAGPMDELVLRFSGSSWVEIVDVTGRRLAFRMGEAGDVLHLRGLAPFDILLGNAPNVAIDYNGAPYRDFPVSRQNVASFTLGRPGTESGDEQ